MANEKSIFTKNGSCLIAGGCLSLLLTGCHSPLVPVTAETAGEHPFQGSVFKSLKAKIWENPYRDLPTYQVDSHRINSTEFLKNAVRTHEF